MKKINFLSLGLVLAIIVLVVAATALKVYTNHKESLLLVASKKIEEAGEKCFLEEKCTGDKTTLGELIEKGYIGEMVHPLTKEYISKDLVVECSNYECKTKID